MPKKSEWVMGCPLEYNSAPQSLSGDRHVVAEKSREFVLPHPRTPKRQRETYAAVAGSSQFFKYLFLPVFFYIYMISHVSFL